MSESIIQEDKERDARIALTRLPGHVYLACDGPRGLCRWCRLIGEFDRTSRDAKERDA